MVEGGSNAGSAGRQCKSSVLKGMGCGECA